MVPSKLSQVMIQMGGHFASRRQEQQRLGRLLRWGPAKRQRWEANGDTWLKDEQKVSHLFVIL